VPDAASVRAAQRALGILGYNAGKADGVIGVATRAAIRAFQKDHKLPQDGELSLVLLQILKQSAEEAGSDELELKAGDVLIFEDGHSEIVKERRNISWSAEGSKRLMAVRPGNAGWPAAARAGLEWALTHALDAPINSSGVKWSSTGVSEQFQIRTFALLQRELDMVGDESDSCRRFELRVEGSSLRYPGFACRDQKNNWFVPHSAVRFRRPAVTLQKSGPPK
jgi:peptidoglycan hydrolase-like protein with peptidoglycan-binding domain